MRLSSSILLVSLLAFGCHSSKKSSATAEAGDESLVIGSSMEQVAESSFALIDAAVPTKASIDCPGVSAQEVAFTDGSVTIYRESRSLSLCTLVLKEFSMGSKTYVFSSVYRSIPRVSLFVATDASDSKLVRDFALFSPITNRPSDCSADGQKCNAYSANFSYSEIQQMDAILENKLIVNDLSVSMSEEQAPECKVSGKWQEPQQFGAEPSLVISVSDCHNNLGTVFIEWGLKYKSSDLSSIQIADAHKLITEGQRRGTIISGQSITLSLSDVLGMMAGNPTPPTDLQALQADFTLAVRNLGGLSVSIYNLHN